MKKLMCILSIIILTGSSCDTNCNDCGPVIHEKYFMENFTNERIKVSWFGSGTPSNLSGEFVIPAKQKLAIHESSNIYFYLYMKKITSNSCYIKIQEQV